MSLTYCFKSFKKSEMQSLVEQEYDDDLYDLIDELNSEEFRLERKQMLLKIDKVLIPLEDKKKEKIIKVE